MNIMLQMKLMPNHVLYLSHKYINYIKLYYHMCYALLCYGNMLETDRWVSLYWMIKVTLSSRFAFLMDTYISEECTAPVFKAPTSMIMLLCSSRMLVPTYQYTTQCHNLAYSNLGIHHCENYEFHTLILPVTNIHKSFLRNTALHIIQNTA